MREIYFTFDDGPSETTPLLLEVLRKEQVAAAFFVTNAYGRPELLKDIARAGHLLCLHSYTHDYSQVYASQEQYFQDLERMQQLVWEETGQLSPFLRFPGGTDNTVSRKYGGDIMPQLLKEVKARGYQVFDWNCENFDGMSPHRTREEYASDAIRSISAQDSAVFLSHTRPTDEESIMALPAIFAWCRENGYAIKRLDEYNGPEVLRLSCEENGKDADGMEDAECAEGDKAASAANAELAGRAASVPPSSATLEEFFLERLAQVNGPFSFTYYDPVSNTSFFARDRFGMVPLYFALDFAPGNPKPHFSDSLKALLQGCQAKERFREDMIEVYLSFSYVPGEDTFFEGIYKALPGYLYTYRNGKLAKKRFFTPTYAFDHGKIMEEWALELERVLDDIVSRQEPGMVALQSSGVDSNYLCARLHPRKTYTAAYAEQQSSEAALAHEYAAGMGIDNQPVLITPELFFSLVGETQEALEQPSCDASAVVLLALAKEIAKEQGAKERAAKEQDVCYSGEGIDELFMGYYYRDLAEVPEELTLEEAEYLGCVQAFFEDEKKQLLKRYTGTKKMRYTREAYELSAGASRIDQAAMVDMLVWMNGNLLPNVYCLGSACGLRLKTPYLDNRLWDLSLKIPAEYRRSATEAKRVFREVAKGVLGTKAQQPKRGFPTPIASWLKQPEYAKRVKAVLASPVAQKFFSVDWILNVYDEFLRDSEGYLSWRPIWCVYCFIVWYDRMVEPGILGLV